MAFGTWRIGFAFPGRAGQVSILVDEIEITLLTLKPGFRYNLFCAVAALFLARDVACLVADVEILLVFTLEPQRLDLVGHDDCPPRVGLLTARSWPDKGSSRLTGLRGEQQRR